MTEAAPIVLDLGTGFLKIGRSSSQFPEFVLPNAVGRSVLCLDESFSRGKLKDVMISDEIDPVRRYLDVRPPVGCGVVENWEDEKLVLDSVFRQKVGLRHGDLNEQVLLIAEAPLNSVDNRKKMMEILFEEFDFKGLQIAPQALLILYAQGLTTGLVVDSGECRTYIMPVFDDHCLTDKMGHLAISGRDITEHLGTFLTDSGNPFHKTSDFSIVSEIKEHLCFVSADTKMDRRIADETTALMVHDTLPHGRVIRVSSERFEAPEALFEPSRLGVRGEGLSKLIYDTVMKTDMTFRKTLFRHIVLSGGTTLFPGLSARIANDLTHLILTNILKGNSDRLEEYGTEVEDPPFRRFLAYCGGTVLANLNISRSSAWIWRHEYLECGVDGIMSRFESIGRSSPH